MCVRSDIEGECFGREIGTLCRKPGIKQKFTPADSAKYSGVAERALALISDTALAARIQAQVLYPGVPSYPSLWAEAVPWACNALNSSAAKANPRNKSPYEMWYGSPPLAGEVWPFLKLAIYRVKRENTSQRKAQDCYYVGPSLNHPRDCMRVLTTHRIILTTHNVTWQHVPPAPPAPQQHLPPIAEEGESTAEEGVSGEGASSQGGGRVADLNSESDLDMTGVGPVLSATRNAPAAEAGAGTGEVAEGNPPAPAERLWQAIMKILPYLNGTKSLGITYVRGSGLSLNVYADADYANKDNGRRSVSGIAVTLGGTVASHASKTQRVVSLSISEAEYIAAGDSVKKALFVCAVFSFIAPKTCGASVKSLRTIRGQRH